MSTLRWLSALLLALAVVAGAALWLQRQEAADLRDELARLHEESRELARLRGENQRLAAALPPAVKLEDLRADRAAVVRLRGEIEKTKDNLQARERALANVAPAVSAVPTMSVAQVPPALVVNMGMSADGSLTSNGQTFEPTALRQQLSTLPRGSTFEIRLQQPKPDANVPFDKMKQSLGAIAEQAGQIAKDLGLKMSLKIEQPPK